MSNSNPPKIFIILGFCLIMVCLFPVLKSGFYSDDLHNFQLRNNAAIRQQSIIDLSRPSIDYWKTTGRYTPISSIWTELAFRYFNTLETYKLFIFIMNLLAIAAFLLYLSSLNLGINPAVWLLCFGAVIQLRITFHDAFSSINAMYQLLAVLVFLSLLFYCLFLKEQKMKFLILSVFLLATALLLSEVGMTVLILMPASALILKAPRKLFLKSYLPPFIIATGYLGYIGWLRLYKFNPAFSYPGLETRFDIKSMWMLLEKQLYASLPLSNLNGQFNIPRIISFQLANPVNLFAIIAVIVIAAVILYKLHKNKPIYNGRLFFSILFFSVLMMIAPAIFILPSVKYQNQVLWGGAYLPVYLQNFGSATLLACLFQYSFNNTKFLIRTFSYALGVFIIISICFSFLYNIFLVDRRSYEGSFPAIALDSFVRNGGLNDCPSGSVIILHNDYYWQAPNLYAMLFKYNTGKDFRVYDIEHGFPCKDSTDNAKCYLLACPAGNPVVASISEINYHDGSILRLLKKSETPCNIRLMPE